MEQHMKSWNDQRGERFVKRKLGKRGCQILGPKKKGRRSRNYINNFGMRQGEFLMKSAGIRDKNFETQRGDSKYYALEGWSCA